MWDNIKAWFKHSETILLARAETAVGVVTAGIGVMDWSPLLGLDFGTAFNRTQVMTLGAIMFVKGVVTEWARRRNDPVMALTTVAESGTPEAVEAKAAVKEVTKKTKIAKKVLESE